MIFYLISSSRLSKQSGNGNHFSMNTILRKEMVNCFRTPELADNTAVHNLWKHFHQKLQKKNF
jgi:hypothetical protein